MKFNASEAPQERYVEIKKDFDHFAQIPFKLLRDTRVSDKAVRLFGIYFEGAHDYRNPGEIKRVRQSEIAERLDCKSKTISVLTRELHNTGWITVKRTGRSNIITLHGKAKKRGRVQ